MLGGLWEKTFDLDLLSVSQAAIVSLGCEASSHSEHLLFKFQRLSVGIELWDDLADRVDGVDAVAESTVKFDA